MILINSGWLYNATGKQTLSFPKETQLKSANHSVQLVHPLHKTRGQRKRYQWKCSECLLKRCMKIKVPRSINSSPPCSTPVNKKELRTHPQRKGSVSRRTHWCCTPELCWCSCKLVSSQRRSALTDRPRAAPPHGRCAPPRHMKEAARVSSGTRHGRGC